MSKHTNMCGAGDIAFRKARESALRILAQREHTEAELNRKLIRRGHDGDVVRQVIAECRRLNYLDDRRALQLVLSRMKQKGFGIHRIRSEMLKRGLASAEAEKDLLECMTPAEEQAVALKVSSKKWKSLKYDPDPQKRKLRLLRFLRSRGFSDAVIVAVSAALDPAEGPVPLRLVIEKDSEFDPHAGRIQADDLPGGLDGGLGVEERNGQGDFIAD